MSQIFVSYKREDQERVKPIVDLLEAQGWSVWWDRQIPPGMTFEKYIEESIAEASCVVAVWSERAVASDWIKTEASEGLKRGILVPVRIDAVDPPFAFRQIHAADLTGLDQRADDDPEIQGLVKSVARLIRREERRRSGTTTGAILRLLHSDAGEEKGEAGRDAAEGRRPGAGAGGVRPAWRRGRVAALGGALAAALGLVAIWGVPYLFSDPEPGPPPEPPKRLTFIGVGVENKEADGKLVKYLEGKVGVQIESVLRDYEAVVDTLAGWDERQGAFLARTTPYVYVAAELLGADLEVLGTYRSRATGTTTYKSYFVVRRQDFPDHTEAAPPTLEEVVDFLRSRRGGRRHRFVYHSKFSTSSYFLPSLVFRRNRIFHAAEANGSLVPIESRQIDEESSTELVRKVARGEADLAAVWDGTKTGFDPGGSEWEQYGREVLFARIDTTLPNDLLVGAGSLHPETAAKIRAALAAMGDAAEDLIDVGDFLRWEEWLEAEGAPEALAALRWSALAPPAPVTIEINDDGAVPVAHVEAARRAVRLSGTEFVVFDPDYHGHADFLWTLEPEHDGALLLTSYVKGSDSNLGLEQEYWISFADESELTERISDFIHSRMHRLRYLWPYATDRPTVIRDVGFALPAHTRVVAQKVDWLNPERNEISEGRRFESRVTLFDLYKLQLEPAGFDDDLLGDPMSNVGYRVILERPSRESSVLRASSYLFVALLVLAAAGAVFDLVRPARRAAAAVKSAAGAEAAKPGRWRRLRATAGAAQAS